MYGVINSISILDSNSINNYEQENQISHEISEKNGKEINGETLKVEYSKGSNFDCKKFVLINKLSPITDPEELHM